MPVKDMNLLRDQLAKVIGENRSLEAKLEEAYGKNAKQALMVDRLALKLSLATAKLDEALAKIAKQEEIIVEVTGSKAKAERILQYYDNAHTPPRNRTITQREINKQKKEGRKKKNPTGRKGRHKGCTNTAVSRKATRTVVHRPDRCKSCGGGNLEAERTNNELVVDIPFIPQIEVVNHRLDTCKCLDCGKITTPSRAGLVRGTSLGPKPDQDDRRPVEHERQLRGHRRVLFGMLCCTIPPFLICRPSVGAARAVVSPCLGMPKDRAGGVTRRIAAAGHDGGDPRGANRQAPSRGFVCPATPPGPPPLRFAASSCIR